MSLGFTYTNRKGILYYLGRGKIKSGKPRYFLSRRAPDEAVLRIPEGLEIAESINGVVSLRRIATQLIRPEELNLVRAELNRHARSKVHLADAARDTITVYEPLGFLSEVFTQSLSDAAEFPGQGRLLQRLGSTWRYERMLRFVLVNLDSREYAVQRMCYRSSMEGWLTLGSGSLAEIARGYVPHLGQETFFELFPWTIPSKNKRGGCPRVRRVAQEQKGRSP